MIADLDKNDSLPSSSLQPSIASASVTIIPPYSDKDKVISSDSLVPPASNTVSGPDIDKISSSSPGQDKASSVTSIQAGSSLTSSSLKNLPITTLNVVSKDDKPKPTSEAVKDLTMVTNSEQTKGPSSTSFNTDKDTFYSPEDVTTSSSLGFDKDKDAMTVQAIDFDKDKDIAPSSKAETTSTAVSFDKDKDATPVLKDTLLSKIGIDKDKTMSTTLYPSIEKDKDFSTAPTAIPVKDKDLTSASQYAETSFAAALDKDKSLSKDESIALSLEKTSKDTQALPTNDKAVPTTSTTDKDKDKFPSPTLLSNASNATEKDEITSQPSAASKDETATIQPSKDKTNFNTSSSILPKESSKTEIFTATSSTSPFLSLAEASTTSLAKTKNDSKAVKPSSILGSQNYTAVTSSVGPPIIVYSITLPLGVAASTTPSSISKAEDKHPSQESVKGDSHILQASSVAKLTNNSSKTINFPGYGIVPAPSKGSDKDSPYNKSGIIPVWTPELLGNAYGGGFIMTPSIYVTKLPYPSGPAHGVPPGYAFTSKPELPGLASPGTSTMALVGQQNMTNKDSSSSTDDKVAKDTPLPSVGTKTLHFPQYPSPIFVNSTVYTLTTIARISIASESENASAGPPAQEHKDSSIFGAATGFPIIYETPKPASNDVARTLSTTDVSQDSKAESILKLIPGQVTGLASAAPGTTTSVTLPALGYSASSSTSPDETSLAIPGSSKTVQSKDEVDTASEVSASRDDKSAKVEEASFADNTATTGPVQSYRLFETTAIPASGSEGPREGIAPTSQPSKFDVAPVPLTREGALPTSNAILFGSIVRGTAADVASEVKNAESADSKVTTTGLAGYATQKPEVEASKSAEQRSLSAALANAGTFLGYQPAIAQAFEQATKGSEAQKTYTITTAPMLGKEEASGAQMLIEGSSKNVLLPQGMATNKGESISSVASFPEAASKQGSITPISASMVPNSEIATVLATGAGGLGVVGIPVSYATEANSQAIPAVTTSYNTSLASVTDKPKQQKDQQSAFPSAITQTPNTALKTTESMVSESKAENKLASAQETQTPIYVSDSPALGTSLSTLAASPQVGVNLDKSSQGVPPSGAEAIFGTAAPSKSIGFLKEEKFPEVASLTDKDEITSGTAVLGQVEAGYTSSSFPVTFVTVVSESTTAKDFPAGSMSLETGSFAVVISQDSSYSGGDSTSLGVTVTSASVIGGSIASAGRQPESNPTGIVLSQTLSANPSSDVAAVFTPSGSVSLIDTSSTTGGGEAGATGSTQASDVDTPALDSSNGDSPASGESLPSSQSGNKLNSFQRSKEAGALTPLSVSLSASSGILGSGVPTAAGNDSISVLLTPTAYQFQFRGQASGLFVGLKLWMTLFGALILHILIQV